VASPNVDRDEIAEDASTEEEQESAEPQAQPSGARQSAVWCFVVNLGGGTGGEQHIYSLMAPRYRLARRGISFVNSPRHANVILVTGILTTHTLDIAQRVIATLPDPHAIVAVGDGILSGGAFVGSDEVIPDAAEVLGVNVEIAGDPPTPEQILMAIEQAAQLLDAAEAGDDSDADDAGDTDEDDGDGTGLADEEEEEE
jgi:Ni,Fe-hydrogenase III small subunit